MGKIQFILGGARSGKSNYAVKLAKESNKKTAFIATCPYYDEDMEERISLHKQERPSGWTTYEEFKDLAPLLEKIDQDQDFGIIIVDCLTLFISNLLLDEFEEDYIKVKITNILNVLRKTKYDSIIVANEVGLSVVPESKLGRKFRDIAGRTNQLVAQNSTETVFMIAGKPLKL
jgi:adenosylcobinamide kinase/adenosylcobinamide-phosphate guanylyltransferase